MKKILSLALFLLFLIIFSFPIFASNEDFDEINDFLPNEYNNILNENKIDIIKDGLSINKMFNILFESAREPINEVASFLAISLTIVFIISIVNVIDFENNSINQRTKDTVINLIFCLTIISLMHDPIMSLSTNIDDVKTTLNTVFSVLTSALLSSGNISTASVYSSSVSVISMIFVNLTSIGSKIFVSLSTCLIILYSVGKANLINTVESIKKFFLIINAISYSIFSFLLSTQSIIANKTESIGIKGAKTVVSKMVPFYGQILSESLKYASTSLSLISSFLGSSIIIVILLLFVPILIKILLYKLSILVLGFILDTLNQSSFSKITSCVGSILDYFLGCFAFICILMFIIISIFIKSSETVIFYG